MNNHVKHSLKWGVMRVTYKENNGGDLKHPLKLGVIRITQEIK